MPRYCHPEATDPDCELCRKYEADTPPGYRAQHDLIAAELVRLGAARAPVGNAVATTAKVNPKMVPLCKHRGGYAGTVNKRQWVKCNHPDKPLKANQFPVELSALGMTNGDAVCSCIGCGPGCRGYCTPEIKPTPES
jgi:hypothetical protein